PVADRTRLALERLESRNEQRVVQLELPQALDTPLVSGDVIRVFSAVDAALSMQRQNKRVRIEGEVLVPGEYVLPPASSISDALTLPDLSLEDGDRVYLPPRPTSVGVFGSVFNAGSYLFMPSRTLGDYLRLAGGPTKGADEGSVFVVRANGQVISTRQDSTWF